MEEKMKLCQYIYIYIEMLENSKIIEKNLLK